MVTFGFEWTDKEFEVCPDCGQPPQVDKEGRKLVMTMSRDGKIVGYKCAWCRGRLKEKQNGTAESVGPE